jgi:CheY-like chemotaxis protein
VVFCDLVMPLVNGWEIARHVKSLKSPPTFNLITGWAQEIPAGDPRRGLVDAMVAKPVDPKIVDWLLAEHKRGQLCQTISAREENTAPGYP